MPSISLPVALGVAGVASAGIGAASSLGAASMQSSAEKSAANTQKAMFDQTRADLAPYNTAGQAATTAIQGMGPFSFSPTEAQLEATPGYKFNLDQGLKATQNSYAARGLATSGGAEKGAASYATGLADSTYQNQFQNALNSYTTNLGKEQNLADRGENAAAQTGQYATQTGANIGQTAVGAANAGAAGIVGAANSVTGGIGSLSNALLYSKFFTGGGGGIYNVGGTNYDPATYTAENGPAGLTGLY